MLDRLLACTCMYVLSAQMRETCVLYSASGNWHQCHAVYAHMLLHFCMCAAGPTRCCPADAEGLDCSSYSVLNQNPISAVKV